MLCCAVSASARQGGVQAQRTPRVASLFAQLQSPGTTDKAEEELFKLAASDLAAREYLAKYLPPMIVSGPKRFDPFHPDPAFQWPDEEWSNAVRLASELKIAEAAPSLARWIGVSTTAITDLTIETSLEFHPAGQALVSIGDPAIPALQKTLSQAGLNDRWDAAYALCLIGSPKAREALRAYAAKGQDPDLASFIRTSLK